MNNLDSRIGLVRRLQAAKYKLTSRSNFLSRAIAKRLLLSGAGAIAGCVSGLFGVASNSSDPEKEKFFLARVEWLPVTSHSHARTHGQTNVR